MLRGRRYIVPGHTYHVTHRCHGRSFFFRYGTDRTVYRAMLRDRLKRFEITLFSYCITSNHVHLLLRPAPLGALASLSGLMQSLEGDFAQYYNLKWKRANAFWGDRYHATMIESGTHFVENYVRRIDEAILHDNLRRNAMWTESLAVGSEAYVKGVGGRIPNRMQVEILEDGEDVFDMGGQRIPRRLRLRVI